MEGEGGEGEEGEGRRGRGEGEEGEGEGEEGEGEGEEGERDVVSLGTTDQGCPLRIFPKGLSGFSSKSWKWSGAWRST